MYNRSINEKCDTDEVVQVKLVIQLSDVISESTGPIFIFIQYKSWEELA